MATKRQKGAAAEPAVEEAESLQRVMQLQAELEVINDDVATCVLQIQREANKDRAPLLERRGAAISTVPNFWMNAVRAPRRRACP